MAKPLLEEEASKLFKASSALFKACLANCDATLFSLSNLL
ncbi:hypothetical protein BBUWI9123_J0009 (plasmid) [Borreliella burgdorferi WI91-23]|nr:hypothetical protein BBUWI9123_J0009 [Borreliella burgdorferi WI91-23]